MQIEPIAFFHSPLTSKFGLPRQGGLAMSLQGRIVFEPAYRHAEAVRGLEAFSHLWLIWGFSANRHDAVGLTVRPPRLGGNERVGVFASRSPFRPNGLGLTCVHIINIEQLPQQGPVIHVQGADLMDGTPIYDVKPYVRYADSYPDAKSGFVDKNEWDNLEVEIPQEVASCFSEEELQGLREVLSLDPRPQYHNEAARSYGMPYAGRDIRFRVAEGRVLVIGQTPLRR
jgi:tRNA-Thr(GGU) m(6)t(6)A37 methyltransferase TsaA